MPESGIADIEPSYQHASERFLVAVKPHLTSRFHIALALPSHISSNILSLEKIHRQWCLGARMAYRPNTPNHWHAFRSSVGTVHDDIHPVYLGLSEASPSQIHNTIQKRL